MFERENFENLLVRTVCFQLPWSTLLFPESFKISFLSANVFSAKVNGFDDGLASGTFCTEMDGTTAVVTTWLTFELAWFCFKATKNGLLPGSFFSKPSDLLNGRLTFSVIEY